MGITPIAAPPASQSATAGAEPKEEGKPAGYDKGLLYLCLLARGAPVPDPNEYTELRSSAGRGDPKAQILLGDCFANGFGIPKNVEEAVSWYRRAADKGDSEAQYTLGEVYHNGEGGTQDYSEAAKWYRMAAEQGTADAQCNLGVVYYKGQGVLED